MPGCWDFLSPSHRTHSGTGTLAEYGRHTCLEHRVTLTVCIQRGLWQWHGMLSVKPRKAGDTLEFKVWFRHGRQEVCHCTTVELQTHTHRGLWCKSPSRNWTSWESLQLGQCGELSWTISERCCDQVSVMERVQPDLAVSPWTLHFIYVFYMLTPEIKINMCQIGYV